MKRTNKISYLAAVAMAISSGLGFVRVPYDKAYDRGGKSSGGSGNRAFSRINDPRYKAWKKAFGGLAVPQFTS